MATRRNLFIETNGLDVSIYLFTFSAGRPAPFATSYMVGRENKRTNNKRMIPTLKNNAAAGYQGPVKIELLKSAGLLFSGSSTTSPLAGNNY